MAKTSKLGVNGKAKGAGFELLIAKTFSEALGVKLRRTPMSGGWSHGNVETAGDLVCVDKNITFPYCIECKCCEGWRMEALFTDKHAWFDNWWEQTMRECPAEKIPILVFSRARQPVFAATRPQDDYQNNVGWPVLETGVNGMRVFVFLLEDLLHSLPTV